MNFPKIGITLGDPGGIGPEVTLKALASKKTLPDANYIIFGSRSLIDEQIETLGLHLKIPSLGTENSNFSISLHEVKHPIKNLKKGCPSKENGEASFFFFKKAFITARKGEINAIVTAPISKKSWSSAGIKWAGHTDYISNFYHQAIMSFWSEKLKVALFTHHIPLKKVFQKINSKDLLDFFLNLYKNIKNLSRKNYQFLVAGLNPHAGENGILGLEEEREIIPAIEKAKKEGMPIIGPFPPDVVFRKGIGKPDKIIIALYHDQALIPFKLTAFNLGVNVTLGLPFVRTSPDHGTAFDIAGRGEANPQSMAEAIKLAYTFCVVP